MYRIKVIDSLSGLADVGSDWDRLRKLETRFFPDYLELCTRLRDVSRRFCVFSVQADEVVVSLACFVFRDGIKSFSVGERRLFGLPVKWCELVGANVLGQCSGDLLKSFMEALNRQTRFDILSLGEVVLGDGLEVATRSLGWKFRISRPARKDSLRWLTRLPESFDEYLGSMSTKSRGNLRREIRKLESELKPTLVTVTRPDQVEDFLRDGERVSRLTYQWNIGQRLVDDEATRRTYKSHAQLGRLRTHIVYADGRPIAFSRGRIVDGTFNYDTPGHDPAFAKYSPGTVLLAWVMRDLIENTKCRLFDFGTGGDDVGYKARFGNLSLPSRTIYVSRRMDLYSTLLTALDAGLTLVKNLGSKLLGQSSLRDRVKRAIRKYG
jgi:hypothetical protein